MPASLTHILAVAVLAALQIAGASAFAKGSSDTCSARSSVQATVPEIAGNAEKFIGRCVAIDAVTDGIYLYESVDGVYLQPPVPLNPASSGFRIGVDHLPSRLSRSYPHVSILGRVQDCETVHAVARDLAEKGELAWVTGYCHYFYGPYLYVHHLRVRAGRPFQRRMGSYARKDYGDLAPAPADWPHRAKVEALANEFLRALRASDRERLAGMHFRDAGLRWEDDERELLHFLLKSRKSPFAIIRTSATAPSERIILVQRFRLQDAATSDDYSATICFCRETSCEGRWPIATFDADNVPSRPYACTDVTSDRNEGRSVPRFITNIGTGGLAEPRGR